VPQTEYGTTARLEWLIRVDVAAYALGQVRSGRRSREVARWGGIDQIVGRAGCYSRSQPRYDCETRAETADLTHTAFRSSRP
jgi:hypothetical protein